MNPWNPPDAYGLAIVPPHGRLSSGAGSGGIPYLLRDGRTAYEPGPAFGPGSGRVAFGQEVVPGLEGVGPLTLFLGPQPEPPTLAQRAGQILQHPATGWAVAAALLGALLVRRGRAATAWNGEPWRGAPWSEPPWSR